MAEINGGELLARCLANEGVKFVFGLPSPGDRSAARAARGARHPPGARAPRGRRRAHGGGPLQDDGQVAAVLGNPGPGSANLLPGVITARHEGVPVVGDHLPAPPRHRLPVAAVDLPGTGSARRLQAGGQVGRPDPLVGAHPRGRAPGLPRDVDGPPRPGAHRAAGAGALRDRRRATARGPAARPPTARRARRRPRRSCAEAAELLAARRAAAGGRRVRRRPRRARTPRCSSSSSCSAAR